MARNPALPAFLLLVCLPAAPALAQCSPNQEDFGVKNIRWSEGASPTSLSISWEAWPGATASQKYDVYMASFGDYCTERAAPDPATKIATVATTSYFATLPPESVVKIAVVPVGCRFPAYNVEWDSFTEIPAKPTRVTATAGASSVEIKITYSDRYAAGFLAQRTSPDGSVFDNSLIDQEANVLLCDHQTLTLNDTGDTGAGLAPGLYRYTLAVGNNRAISSCNEAGCVIDFAGGRYAVSDPIYVVVGSGCPAPNDAPALAGPGDAPLAGRDALFTWTSVPLASGAYLLESSRDPSFATIETSLETSAVTALMPTKSSGSDFTLSVRVRGVQGCGTPGPVSNVVALPVRGAPAALSVDTSSISWTATAGGAPPAASLRVKNVGGSSARVSVLQHGDFFDATPATLDLAPDASANVALAARASAVAAEGGVAGRLELALSNTNHVDVSVTLSVVPAGAGSAGAKLAASTSQIVFSAPAGQDPAPKTITIRAATASPSRNPVYVTASIGPGGSWLVLPSSVAGPIAPDGTLELPLSVARGRRSALDGPAPLRTLLSLVPVGGSAADGALIEVLDVEASSVTSGGGRGARPRLSPLVAPPGGTSFIVPSAVSASGAGGAFFLSDGWLRNDSSSPFTANLFYTPDGKNGLADPGVLATTFVVPPGSTRRLSSFVSTLLGTSGSGEVEVRADAASTSLLPAVSLRTTVESVTGGDATSRYGTEMPTVSFGAGVGRGDGELVIPGVDDDAAKRANLILAETTGAEATVSIRVTDANGADLGTIGKTVPPYGKIQVNRLVTAAKPGATLTGGSAGVTVTGGSGRVVAVATIIDNASNSFSAVLGRVTPESAPAPTSSSRSALGAAASTRALVIPSVARLPGAFSTQFITSMSITNGTAAEAHLTLTYHYNDVDTGGAKTAQTSVTIPPRGSLPKSLGADAIVSLMGVTNRSFGWIRMTGDVARVVAVSAVSAQVDPSDPSKGFKTAQVDGVLDGSPDLMGASEPERRFAGSEKSVQRRTNLILVETGGAPATATIRAYGPTGEVLATRSVDVAPNQYYQINDVFGDSGLTLGAGPFQNVPIGVSLQSGDPNARVIGLVTVNDNISRNPEIFVLRTPGTPPPTIGF